MLLYQKRYSGYVCYLLVLYTLLENLFYHLIQSEKYTIITNSKVKILEWEAGNMEPMKPVRIGIVSDKVQAQMAVDVLEQQGIHANMLNLNKRKF